MKRLENNQNSSKPRRIGILRPSKTLQWIRMTHQPENLASNHSYQLLSSNNENQLIELFNNCQGFDGFDDKAMKDILLMAELRAAVRRIQLATKQVVSTRQKNRSRRVCFQLFKGFL